MREGRQKGSRTNIGKAAATGRVEFVGVRGLTAGASFWTGSTGFAFQPRFDVPVTLVEADARYARGMLHAGDPSRAVQAAEDLRTALRLKPDHPDRRAIEAAIAGLPAPGG